MKTKFFRKIMAVVLLVSSVPGGACATSATATNVPRAEPQASAQTQIETRVYVRKQCVLSESNDRSSAGIISALASIFIPILVGKALTGISSAIRKAGSPETLRDAGRLPTYLYQLSKQGDQNKLSLNPNLGCVIVVRGTFSGPDTGDQSQIGFPVQGVFLTVAEEDKRIERLKACNIPVTKIAVAYEAKVITSNDSTALHYENRFLEVNEFQGKRSSDTRGMVVSIAINGVGTKQGDTSLSLALMELGEIKKGTILGPAQLRRGPSSWLGGLGLSTTALAAIEKIKLLDDESRGVAPATVEGTFVETEDGNKALLFIADVLDSAKQSLNQVISDEITPESREERSKNEADALETLLAGEESTFAIYLTAVNALARLDTSAAPTERAIKEFDVKKAKRAWCRKFDALSNLGSAPDRSPHSCP